MERPKAPPCAGGQQMVQSGPIRFFDALLSRRQVACSHSMNSHHTLIHARVAATLPRNSRASPFSAAVFICFRQSCHPYRPPVVFRDDLVRDYRARIVALRKLRTAAYL